MKEFNLEANNPQLKKVIPPKMTKFHRAFPSAKLEELDLTIAKAVS